MSLESNPLITLNQIISVGLFKLLAVLTSSSMTKLTEQDFTYVGYLYHSRKNCNQQRNMNGNISKWTYYQQQKFYHKQINFDDSICTDQNKNLVVTHPKEIITQ